MHEEYPEGFIAHYEQQALSAFVAWYRKSKPTMKGAAEKDDG